MAEQEKSSPEGHKKSEDVLLLAVSALVGGAKNEENARISVWRRIEHNFTRDGVILSHSESRQDYWGLFVLHSLVCQTESRAE